jgi:hypothetical protein
MRATVHGTSDDAFGGMRARRKGCDVSKSASRWIAAPETTIVRIGNGLQAPVYQSVNPCAERAEGLAEQYIFEFQPLL